jgi:hypothetical protein
MTDKSVIAYSSVWPLARRAIIVCNRDVTMAYDNHQRSVVAKRKPYSSCAFSRRIVIACMMGNRYELPDMSGLQAQEVHEGD